MAENEQNTEMEDILSSIKNILEEDEQQRSSEARRASDEVGAETDVLGDVLASSPEIDDILELSPEMRIEDGVPEETPANVDPVAELTNNEVEDPLAFVTDEVSEPVEGVNIGTEDLDSDSVFEANDFEPLTPELPQETGSEEPAEPFWKSETVADSEDNFETVAEPEPSIEVEPEVEITAEPEIVDVNTEPAVEPEVIEPETVANPEPETAEKEENAVDVSANIISNFAKMFSKEEPVVQETTVVENISAPGDTSKTLEEFVLASIIKVIGGEISQKWNNGAEFRAFAETEIERQTREWINDNLPTLVEKVVKQEIERVIAKVGS